MKLGLWFGRNGIFCMRKREEVWTLGHSVRWYQVFQGPEAGADGRAGLARPRVSGLKYLEHFLRENGKEMPFPMSVCLNAIFQCFCASV